MTRRAYLLTAVGAAAMAALTVTPNTAVAQESVKAPEVGNGPVAALGPPRVASALPAALPSESPRGAYVSFSPLRPQPGTARSAHSVHKPARVAAAPVLAARPAGVRTVNEPACAAIAVTYVALRSDSGAALGSFPFCMQPPDGDEVATCVTYNTDGTWTYAPPQAMSCSSTSMAAMVDPEITR